MVVITGKRHRQHNRIKLVTTTGEGKNIVVIWTPVMWTPVSLKLLRDIQPCLGNSVMYFKTLYFDTILFLNRIIKTFFSITEKRFSV